MRIAEKYHSTKYPRAVDSLLQMLSVPGIAMGTWVVDVNTLPLELAELIAKVIKK
jgi:hypothetical protein